MRICIVGDPEDLCAVYLGWLAERRGGEVLWLPEHEYGLSWTFHMGEDPAEGRIEAAGQLYRFDCLDGALVRFNPRPCVPPDLGLSPDDEAIYTLERRYGLQWFLDRVPFQVVNRPCAGRSNSSKPYQMLALQRAGFTVPRWIATNEWEAAVTFLESCPSGAVYKACSGLRCRVRRVEDAVLERLREGTAPVVIQEYVAGTDIRVHVVGDGTFGAESASGTVDYRFDCRNTQFRPTEVPSGLRRRCVRFAAEEGLSLAGFDFRRSPDGSLFCLEMNPVPTFLPYEAGSGQRIGDAILDLLGTLPAPDTPVSPLAISGQEVTG